MRKTLLPMLLSAAVAFAASPAGARDRGHGYGWNSVPPALIADSVLGAFATAPVYGMPAAYGDQYPVYEPRCRVVVRPTFIQPYGWIPAQTTVCE